MTAQAKDVPLNLSLGSSADYPMLTNVKIWDGSLVGLTSAGYAQAFALGNEFAGHANRQVDNASGGSGAKNINVTRGRYFARVALANVALTDAQRQAPVFVQDSGTLSLRAGQLVGRVVHYEASGYAIVEFDTALQVHCLAETLLFGGFTDNTNTTGYKDFATTIPAGALVLGWQAHVVTGFTGDTTAVAKVGDSGSVGRFSADTAQSVFTASTNVGAAAVAATAYCVAAVTPRVTVTGGADFTSISAGEMDVKILYIPTLRI